MNRAQILASERRRHDPLELRLLALCGLIDDVIASLTRRRDRFHEMRAALALARAEIESETPSGVYQIRAPRPEPTTRTRAARTRTERQERSG